MSCSMYGFNAEPIGSAVRKINELVKRVRMCKVHAYIIGYLKDQMPMLMGHSKKQAQVSMAMMYQHSVSSQGGIDGS